MKEQIPMRFKGAVQTAHVAPPTVDALVRSASFRLTDGASIVHPRPSALQSYYFLQKQVCLRNEIAKRLVLFDECYSAARFRRHDL